MTRTRAERRARARPASVRKFDTKFKKGRRGLAPAPGGRRSKPALGSAQPFLQHRGIHAMLEGALSVDLHYRDVVLVLLVQLARPSDVDLAELERYLPAH